MKTAAGSFTISDQSTQNELQVQKMVNFLDNGWKWKKVVLYQILII